MSAVDCGHAPAQRDYLSNLPPEILHKIFLGRSTPDEPFLPVASTAVCRALLAFTRAAAYRHLTFDCSITLAAFGSIVSTPGCAHLGQLVETATVAAPVIPSRASARSMAAGEEMLAGWLGESFKAAFEGMTNLREVHLGRVDLLEEKAMLLTKGWQTVERVSIKAQDNVEYRSLRWIHLAPKLKELDIETPMRYEASTPTPTGLFEPGKSAIKTVRINAEPHSSEFEAFFEHCDLTELHLRSSTTDAHRVFSSLGDRARASLETISFATTGYLHHALSTTFGDFPRLKHLSLLSTQTALSPTLFTTLSPLPLKSLSLAGPRTSAEVGHLAHFVAYERPETLGQVGVDVERAWVKQEKDVQAEGQREGEDVEEERGARRQVKRLREACERSGVRLGGNVSEL